jgi:hypothetical protein
MVISKFRYLSNIFRRFSTSTITINIFIKLEYKKYEKNDIQ